tara:strand:+ start:27430 stop:27846 length:417 start_codon:yes stop_codon:yes gene_type:complete
MAIHHINLRATASAIDNLSVISDAMAWLCGDVELILTDRTTSYHGSEMYILSAKIAKNRAVSAFVGKLKQGGVSVLAGDLAKRIDENNTLHFRLCLDSVIDQKISFAESGDKTVKCSIKIESYPGDSPIEKISAELGI